MREVEPVAHDKLKAVAKAGAFYAGWLPTLVAGKGQVPNAYAEFGPLAHQLRYVERTTRKLARSIFYGMGRWQGAMERKQAFLGRVVDIGAELFAMTAACGRAKAERQSRPGGVQLADLFCDQARVRIGALFTALWSNTDDADDAAAKDVLAGQYAFVESGIKLPADDGPWVSPAEPGPSSKPDVRRVVPRPSVEY